MMMPRLKSRPQGGCIYLGDYGCTIYEKRPEMCRVFDCRKMFLETTRTERRHLTKTGVADKRIFEAGRARSSDLGKDSPCSRA